MIISEQMAFFGNALTESDETYGISRSRDVSKGQRGNGSAKRED
jgi:hypothetical protein